jgi:hypothetical protein
MGKYLNQLAYLMMNGEEGKYNEDFKKKYKMVGLKAMKELARLLDLKEFDINFNPGGIAVSGDLRLMGMWSEGSGVYITMNKDFPHRPWGDVLYRTIKHTKDFTGGPNNWLEFKLLQFPEVLRERIMGLGFERG